MACYEAHCQYIDIALDYKIKAMIDNLKNWTLSQVSSCLNVKDNSQSSCSQIWDKILKDCANIEVTEKQVYAEWAHINSSEWRLDEDQVKSSISTVGTIDYDRTI